MLVWLDPPDGSSERLITDEIILLRGMEVWACTLPGGGTSSSLPVRVALPRTALHHHSFTSNCKIKIIGWPPLLTLSLGVFFVIKSQGKKGENAKSAKIGILP